MASREERAKAQLASLRAKKKAASSVPASPGGSDGGNGASASASAAAAAAAAAASPLGTPTSRKPRPAGTNSAHHTTPITSFAVDWGRFTNKGNAGAGSTDIETLLGWRPAGTEFSSGDEDDDDDDEDINDDDDDSFQKAPSPSKWNAWKQAVAPNGRPFFVNEENGERCWTRPSPSTTLMWHFLRALARAAPEACELIMLTVVLCIHTSPPRRIRRKQSWTTIQQSVAAAEFVPTVVVDAGASAMRIGYGGDRTPRAVFPPMVTRTADGELLVGEAALVEGCRRASRGDVNIAVCRGLVTNWKDMERVFRHIFVSELRVDSAVHPVLVTEPPMTPVATREKLAALLFETFKVPAVYVASQPALAFGASSQGGRDGGALGVAPGKSSSSYGVVIDSGDSSTHVVPVYCGHAIPHATQSLNIAGHDLTLTLMKMINPTAEAAGYSFTSTEEDKADAGEMACRGEQPYHVARKIKEVSAYVALDFEAEVAAQGRASTAEDEYDLPNGEKLLLGNARFWAPEALFLPALMGSQSPGLPELVVAAVEACDSELRDGMYASCLLTGGSTLLPGLVDRLEKELTCLCPDVPKITVLAPPGRRHATWAGGASLAGTARFTHSWVSRKEYTETGPKVLGRKFF